MQTITKERWLLKTTLLFIEVEKLHVACANFLHCYCRFVATFRKFEILIRYSSTKTLLPRNDACAIFTSRKDVCIPACTWVGVGVYPSMHLGREVWTGGGGVWTGVYIHPPTQKQPLQRAVRILLDCILVVKLSCQIMNKIIAHLKTVADSVF